MSKKTKEKKIQNTNVSFSMFRNLVGKVLKTGAEARDAVIAYVTYIQTISKLFSNFFFLIKVIPL